MAALGHIKVLEEAIGYIAGYGVTLWLFFQDLAQLEKTYRKWRAVTMSAAASVSGSGSCGGWGCDRASNL